MEILFENPLILIILIGIISSLFKNKNKGEKQNSPSKRVETKPVQKNGDPFSEIKDIFKEVQRGFQEELKPVQKGNTPQKVIEDKFVNQEESIKPSKIEQVVETPRKLQDQKSKQHSVLKVDESKLIDAVIWSEVLGPPRAKKPYSQNRLRGKY